MFKKKQYRNELAEKTEKLTPENPYQITPVNPARRRKVWVLSSIGGSLVVVGVVAISLYAGGVFERMGYANINADLLVKPTSKKVVDNPTYSFSKSTYDSYLAFASKFTQLAFDTSVIEKGEKSLGVSLPDAYLSLALTAFTSSEEAENDILSFLELPDEEALKTAAKEVVSTLCTLSLDNQGKYQGGYNLNSLWLDPNQVQILPKNEELYSTLADLFDVSVYRRGLTDKNANAYLEKNGLADLAKPTINLGLDDSNAFAFSSMSVYYCMDNFPLANMYESQFRSGNHKMDYTVSGSTSPVDFIETIEEESIVYQGNGFVGSAMPIHSLTMTCFLPDEVTGSPYAILPDVLSSSYQVKTYQDRLGNTQNRYNVFLKAPYFKLDNHLNIDRSSLETQLPVAANGGVGEKIAKSKGNPVAFQGIAQQSLMTFDYNGFYSCSVTIYEGGTTSFPSLDSFTLRLDHPYLFEISQPKVMVEGSEKSVPMVIGEIMEPGYEAA